MPTSSSSSDSGDPLDSSGSGDFSSSEQDDSSSSGNDDSSDSSESSDSSDSSSGSSSEQIEIEFNESANDKEAIVRLKSNIPEKRFKTACRIRAVNSTAAMTVILKNPDKRLRFPENETKEIELPANGEWKEFEISGEKASEAIGDAEINVHKGNANGPKIGSASATVYYFEPSDITVARGSAYVLGQGNWGEYRPANGRSAVNYSAVATLKPSGVDCEASALKYIRIAVLQNVSSIEFRYRYSNPLALTWEDWVPVGTEIEVPQTIDVIATNDGWLLDGNDETGPVYEIGGGTDPDAIQKPKGCPQGKEAKTIDTPNSILKNLYSYEVKLNGAKALTVIYDTPVKIVLKASFRTWVVTFEEILGERIAPYPLRQTEWSIDLDSSQSSAQHATVPQHDHDVTEAPITDPPYANKVMSQPNADKQEAVGAATKNFTKPAPSP